MEKVSDQLICSVKKNLLNFIILKHHPNVVLNSLRTEESTVFLLGGISS